MAGVRSSRWCHQGSLLCIDHGGQEEKGGHKAVGEKLSWLKMWLGRNGTYLLPSIFALNEWLVVAQF